MSDPTTLTPPADAPLPYVAHDPGSDWPEILDGDGHVIAQVCVHEDANSPLAHRGMVSLDVARYLVAAANAAPAMLAELAALRAQVARQQPALDACIAWQRAVDAYSEANAFAHRCDASELRSAHGRTDLAWYEMRRTQAVALDAIRTLDAEARRG